ncbi:unnamed protein product [Phytophthora fragariaefolia]|uniref:Unnamed protein product n=1 Tax=Phytophthora fragariaefolia TaxID=1490495 RepID=A0A9W7CNM4_9STRA|nr:unnamed protein product [Phytophthora fragariaefolia]
MDLNAEKHFSIGFSMGEYGPQAEKVRREELVLLEHLHDAGMAAVIVADEYDIVEGRGLADVPQHPPDELVASVGLEGPKAFLRVHQPVLRNGRDDVDV